MLFQISPKLGYKFFKRGAQRCRRTSGGVFPKKRPQYGATIAHMEFGRRERGRLAKLGRIQRGDAPNCVEN